MATNTVNPPDPTESNEFLIVDRLDQTLGKFELEAKIFNLREEILLLKSWKNTCEKFQEKFFELFIAFTVLVTPLAIAFVFNYLFSNVSDYNLTKDMIYNCTNCPPEWDNFPPCPNKADESCGRSKEAVCCLLLPPSSSTTQHIRDAVVPVLIAISFIVGLPYYYHMMDELSHTNTIKEMRRQDDESGSEDDEDDSGEDADESDALWEDDGGEKKKKESKDSKEKMSKETKETSKKGKDETKGVDVNLISID